MSHRRIVPRLVLALALIANALPSAAGMAMALGLAPCAHGPAASSHGDATAAAEADEHPCHHPAAPEKTPTPPCCADGKCQCSAIGAAAVLVATLPMLPQAHPELAPGTPPTALAPPAPAELLRPPIA